MVVLASLSVVSCVQLVDVSTITNTYQYFAITSTLFNSGVFGVLISIVLIIQTAGSLIAYTIVIMQNFYWWNYEQHFLYMQLALWGILLAFIFPLASLRNLRFLHWTSYITIFVVLYVVIVTIVFYFNGDVKGGPPVVYSLEIISLTAIPLFQGSYCCHYQIANIYRDLKQKTVRRMVRVVTISMAIVVTLYSLTALFGYLTFTSNLSCPGCSNLLKAFTEKAGGTWYLHGANVLMLVCMVAHYPLPCFGLRRTVESLIWRDMDAPAAWRYLICLAIIVTTGLIGSFVTEIHTVLDFTSSIAGSFVVFIFPGLFSLRTHQKLRRSRWRLFFAIVTMTTGLFVASTGLFSSIYELVQKQT